MFSMFQRPIRRRGRLVVREGVWREVRVAVRVTEWVEQRGWRWWWWGTVACLQFQGFQLISLCYSSHVDPAPSKGNVPQGCQGGRRFPWLGLQPAVNLWPLPGGALWAWQVLCTPSVLKFPLSHCSGNGGRRRGDTGSLLLHVPHSQLRPRPPLATAPLFCGGGASSWTDLVVLLVPHTFLWFRVLA